MGRPSKYTDVLAAMICERIANGESLRRVCEDESIPALSTVCKWLNENKVFSEQYKRAREDQADLFAAEILEIADDGRNDWMERQGKDGESALVVDHEHIQRSRLRVDTRKWLMARMAPKKYGDRVTNEHVGADGGPIQTESRSSRDLAKAVAAMLAKGMGDGEVDGEGAE